MNCIKKRINPASPRRLRQALWSGLLLFAMPMLLSAQWIPFLARKSGDISGLRIVQASPNRVTFLFVHDNKKPDQPRLGLARVNRAGLHQLRYFPWPAEQPLPVDLEALALLPASGGLRALLVSSSGGYWQVELDTAAGKITIELSGRFPQLPADPELEGFDLQQLGQRWLAVWGARGEDARPGRLYWAWWSPQGIRSVVDSAHIQVPWPRQSEVRHISELRLLEDATLLISAASDPGDNGPFASALYLAGSFRLNALNEPRFVPLKKAQQLFRFPHHKVEAFDLWPGGEGGLFFATDDENFGSMVTYTRWNRP